MISEKNIKAYARGASFLGSGKGNSPRRYLHLIEHFLKRYGDINIMNIKDAPDQDVIISVKIMGIPTLQDQKSLEGLLLIHALIDAVQRKHGVVKGSIALEMVADAALSPFWIAGKLGLGVYDGELLCGANDKLLQTMGTPLEAYVCDPLSGAVEMIAYESLSNLEAKTRTHMIKNNIGCVIVVPMVLTGKQLKEKATPYSISRSLDIGQMLIDQTLPHDAQWLFDDHVVYWDQKIEKGVLKGSATMACGIVIGINDGYDTVKKDDNVLAQSPDIITLLDPVSFRPLLTKELEIGDVVKAVVLRNRDHHDQEDHHFAQKVING
jgi:DUF917 family protein